MSGDYNKYLTALQQLDPYTTDILARVKKVTLFIFCGASGQWQSTNVEGEFFVCAREREPFNTIHILNKTKNNNLMEPIVEDWDWKTEESLLLYRKGQNIFGIRFYNEIEYRKISTLVETIMESLKHKVEPPRSGVNIINMLNQAQEDFEKVAGMIESQLLQKVQQSGSPQVHRPSTPQAQKPATPPAQSPVSPQVHRPGTPHAQRPSSPQAHGSGTSQIHQYGTPPDLRPGTPQILQLAIPQTHRPGTPQVQQLSSPQVHRHTTPQIHRSPRNNRPPRMQHQRQGIPRPPIQRPPRLQAKRTGNFQVQRLGLPQVYRQPIPLFYPQGIAQIQRPTTPQYQRPPPPQIYSQDTAQDQRPASPQIQRPEPLQIQRPSTTQIQRADTPQVHRPDTPQIQQPEVQKSDTPQVNGLSIPESPRSQVNGSNTPEVERPDSPEIPDDDSDDGSQDSRSTLRASSPADSVTTVIDAGLEEEETAEEKLAHLTSFLSLLDKPLLITPEMFEKKMKEENGCRHLAVETPEATVDNPLHFHPSLGLDTPEPLNQRQMIQAMIYLLKNDPEFVGKLHAAYIKAFLDML